eukprot:561695-Pleurochrysis_carterae.AAC.1
MAILSQNQQRCTSNQPIARLLAQNGISTTFDMRPNCLFKTESHTAHTPPKASRRGFRILFSSKWLKQALRHLLCARASRVVKSNQCGQTLKRQTEVIRLSMHTTPQRQDVDMMSFVDFTEGYANGCVA